MKSNPLKWHGGKQYLAKQIIALFPPRDSYIHYVEPFFGGGAVLFAHDPEGKSEVVNDINWELANFWSVLRCDLQVNALVRLCEATAFDKTTWDFVADPSTETDHPVDRAWRFFVRYRQSRQGLGKDFATLSRNRTRRGMNEQVASWLSAVEGLPEAHERLRRVVILCDDALKVIRAQDGPKTLFYLDPPYLHETRTVTDAYQHEMTAEEHQKLLCLLSEIKGRFLLSGYPSELYDGFARRFRWRRVDIAIDNKASCAKVKEIKAECVWMSW